MDRIYRANQNQVNNVGLGSKWSQDFPIGPAYRYIDIVITMTTAAGLTANAVTDFIDLTTLFANGKPFRQFLGKEAASIYGLYSDPGSGVTTAGNFAPIIG